MTKSKDTEFKVVFERDIPDELRDEVELAIKEAVLEKLARIDFEADLSLKSFRGITNGGHTAGMFIR